MNINRIRGVLLFLALVLALSGFGFTFDQGEKTMEQRTIGERFHQETSLTWRSAIGDVFAWKPPKPPPYKNYPKAKRIALPIPGHEGSSVETALRKRRSVRNYSNQPMTLAQLAQLLFAAQGITGRMYGCLLYTSDAADE